MFCTGLRRQCCVTFYTGKNISVITAQVIFLGHDQPDKWGEWWSTFMSHILVRTLLKIGTRCPREEKQIPKWAYLIEYHLPLSVWPAQTLRSTSTLISVKLNTDGGTIRLFTLNLIASCHLKPALISKKRWCRPQRFLQNKQLQKWWDQYYF